MPAAITGIAAISTMTTGRQSNARNAGASRSARRCDQTAASTIGPAKSAESTR